MSTQQIIQQLAAGAQAGTDFAQLLKPQLPFLRRYALRLTGNSHDSEDLLQDVMLKLYQQRERLLDVEALQPWVARVMYHQYIDQYRRQRHSIATVSMSQAADEESDHPAFEIADDAPCPEGQLQVQEAQGQLDRALQQLPKEVRELVRLHEIEGLSLPEIAQQLSIPLNTLKSRLRRARHVLRASLLAAPEPVAEKAPPEVNVARPFRPETSYHAWA